jgi:predicted unusual protein kinase regulating ubiquinone biosynthesis (AarF/ABC1/UbiB family)
MSDEEPKRLPGRLERTWKTAWLGGAMGTRLVSGKIADAFRQKEHKAEAARARHLESARRLVSTMTELRGPIMKIGQLLSTHAEALPEDVARALASLQEGAPPMSFETIREVVEADLGSPIDTLFAELDRDAIAAASLGQVHRGRLFCGTRVAVKVQYPGAASSVDADMKNVELGASMVKRTLADLLGQKRLDVTPFAEELAEHLRQETDYCREAYNAKLLRALFADDPLVLVPRVHDSHSGLRVITYDFVEGETLDWGLRHDDPAIRERTVVALTHAFWRQLFGAGVLHADPHPGNFRVLPDGRLGILDYGCVKIFSESFLVPFADMVVARMHGDEARFVRAMVDLELLEDPSDEAALEDMRRIADYCSVGLKDTDTVFDFSGFSYVDEGRRLIAHFLGRRTLPPAQRDFLFLTRVILGYYEYFSRAGARMDFRARVMPYVEHGFTHRVIEIPPYDAG